MKFRMVIASLSQKEQDYLISQYKKNNCEINTNKNGWLTIEAEDSFERCMILMAIGMHFPDYSVTMISQGGDGCVKGEKKEDTS